MTQGVALRLTPALAILMLSQALLGLVLRERYRDVEWIRATWLGNDWVTLTGAVPLLWLGAARAARGSVRGLLLWLGMLAYAAYNYAFYLFGAALNAFFPLYVALTVLPVVTLGCVVTRVDVRAVAGSIAADVPARLIGGYLAGVSAGLAAAWMGRWGAYVFGGVALPVEPEAFKVVAALDLGAMVPALAAGGVLLWTRRPWGYVIAAMASIQGALYLFVLSVNSLIAIRADLVPSPGELPLWGTLTVLTTAAAMRLVASAGHTSEPWWRS